MNGARWWLGIGNLLLAAVASAADTGIAVRITGLPALPASVGVVRLVDLPRLLPYGANSAIGPRWLVVGSGLQALPPLVEGKAPPKVPTLGQQVAPTYRDGNLVASF